MPWKRTRNGMFKRPSRLYKGVSKTRPKKQGYFKRKVKSIARSVVYAQKEWKFFDQFVLANMSTASVPLGGSVVLAAINLTQLPAQGLTGSTRVGTSIKVSSVDLKAQINNVTAATNTVPANKSLFVRVAILELMDQQDVGSITTIPGNAMLEFNSANLDLQTTSNRMTNYFNRRFYKIHYDKVMKLGSITRDEATTTQFWRHKMKFNGQEWTADVNTQDTAKQRSIWAVAFIDSQDGDRSNGAAAEGLCRIRWECRMGFTDS